MVLHEFISLEVKQGNDHDQIGRSRMYGQYNGGNMKKIRQLAGSLCLLGVLASTVAAAQEDERTRIMDLAASMEPFSLRVVGPPVSTPEWLHIDQPFWRDMVGELSGDKVTVSLQSVTELNVPAGDAFTLVSRGTYDVADTTANYASGELRALDGLDLAGVATSMDAEQRVLQSFAPYVAEGLQARYGVKLLGLGAAGAQVFFCDGDINGLADLRGKRVRVAASTLADFLSYVGATPITMDFGEVLQALQRGIVDCVVTGAMGGNTAKLTNVADTLFTLTMGWAPKVRIANGEFWSSLDEAQRAWLQAATDYYYARVALPVQVENLNQGIWCSVGDERCSAAGEGGVEKADLRLLEPSEADLELARKAVEGAVLVEFGKACGPECARTWNETVGAELGVRIDD